VPVWTDGQIQKTPVGPPTEQPKQTPGGLKGRIVEKKAAEMKDYMDRLKGLISHYAPPDPQKIRTAKEAGRVNSAVSGGAATITVHDYYKTGDQVAFGFDPAAKKPTSLQRKHVS
jgi:hypothetical protein